MLNTWRYFVIVHHRGHREQEEIIAKGDCAWFCLFYLVLTSANA